MIGASRAFIAFEAATFIVAALIHAGALVTGYEHDAARTAESVIAAVLVVGLIVTYLRPMWTRGAALIVQGFALLGTLVGIFTIIVGVGPRTLPDVIYHVAIIIVLAWGLLTAYRFPTRQA